MTTRMSGLGFSVSLYARRSLCETARGPTLLRAGAGNHVWRWILPMLSKGNERMDGMWDDIGTVRQIDFEGSSPVHDGARRKPTSRSSR